MKAFPFWLTLSILMATVLGQTVNPLAFDDPVYGWTDNRDPNTPRVSPNSVVGLQLGFTRVMIAYGSPALGQRSPRALLRSGNLWRTGADEATTISFDGGVVIEGRPVPAGSYSLFTIPGPSTWTIILNRRHNVWGTSAYDSSEDQLRFTVAVAEAPRRERLSFSFAEYDPEVWAATIVLRWGTARISFQIHEP